METCSRKTDNFIRTKGWLLLWHALPVIALLLWGAFGIRNNLWYDEAIFSVDGISALETADLYYGDG